MPTKAASFASSSLWMSWVPQMKRTEDMPKPCVSMALWAAAITFGVRRLSPR
jgi:hypothetical protein